MKQIGAVLAFVLFAVPGLYAGSRTEVVLAPEYARETMTEKMTFGLSGHTFDAFGTRYKTVPTGLSVGLRRGRWGTVASAQYTGFRSITDFDESGGSTVTMPPSAEIVGSSSVLQVSGRYWATSWLSLDADWQFLRVDEHANGLFVDMYDNGDIVILSTTASTRQKYIVPSIGVDVSRTIGRVTLAAKANVSPWFRTSAIRRASVDGEPEGVVRRSTSGRGFGIGTAVGVRLHPNVSLTGAWRYRRLQNRTDVLEGITEVSQGRTFKGLSFGFVVRL